MLSVPAPAKINLFLHVGARRADGYHALQSLVCFAEAGDILTFARARTLSLSVEGPFAEGLSGESDNLILRAARALAARAGVAAGAAITLTKNLPVASGIGGGSADAAAALRGLVDLWNVNISSDALHEIALSLGSDVPVCVQCKPAMMEGRGEYVTPAGPLPPMAMLLVNPGVPVATAAVFRALEQRSGVEGAHSDFANATPPSLVEALSRCTNDLEVPACIVAPEIAQVLSALRGADNVLLARMCGSGATCYALFESDAAADAAAQKIAAAHPAWWVMPTRIAPAKITL